MRLANLIEERNHRFYGMIGEALLFVFVVTWLSKHSDRPNAAWSKVKTKPKTLKALQMYRSKEQILCLCHGFLRERAVLLL